LILPLSGAELEAAAELAESAVTAGKSNRFFPWFQLSKGLAEYRQGHFESAVEWLRKTLEGQINALDDHRFFESYMVLAMAHWQLKQSSEARLAFAKGVEIEETKLPKLDSGDRGEAWRDLIIGHALMNEAKALMGDGPQASRQIH